MACLKGAAKEGREGGRLRLERSMNDLLVVILFFTRDMELLCLHRTKVWN